MVRAGLVEAVFGGGGQVGADGRELGESGFGGLNPDLTFGQHSSTLTRPGEVCAVFGLPDRDNHAPDRDRHCLDVMH